MFILSEFWVKSRKDLLGRVSRNSFCAAIHPSVQTYSFMEVSCDPFIWLQKIKLTSGSEGLYNIVAQICLSPSSSGCWAASSRCDCEICGFQGYFGTGVGGNKASENVTKLTVPSSSLFFFLFWKKHSLGCLKNLVNFQSFGKVDFYNFVGVLMAFREADFQRSLSHHFCWYPSYRWYLWFGFCNICWKALLVSFPRTFYHQCSRLFFSLIPRPCGQTISLLPKNQDIGIPFSISLSRQNG